MRASRGECQESLCPRGGRAFVGRGGKETEGVAVKVSGCSEVRVWYEGGDMDRLTTNQLYLHTAPSAYNEEKP